MVCIKNEFDAVIVFKCSKIFYKGNWKKWNIAHFKVFCAKYFQHHFTLQKRHFLGKIQDSQKKTHSAFSIHEIFTTFAPIPTMRKVAFWKDILKFSKSVSFYSWFSELRKFQKLSSVKIERSRGCVGFTCLFDSLGSEDLEDQIKRYTVPRFLFL